MTAQGRKKKSTTRPKQARPDPGQGTSGTKRRATDQSLQAEREKADLAGVEKLTTLEQEADQIVQVARARADEVVRVARDDADSLAGDPLSTDAKSRVQRQRARENLALGRERGHADSVLQREREARKGYLADFLAIERDATNQKLMDERAHSDGSIATRDHFLEAVSHDLRSLLSSLALNAELLGLIALEGEAGDRVREYAGRARRATTQMNRLINDLLDVVSIEAGGLAVIPERVEVATILQDTADLFQGIAAAAHITLDVQAPKLPLHAELDEGRITQVLANLISNAIKFTPANGRVSIRAQRLGKEILFTVSDTGIGIPKDELQSVFRRLRQVRADRRGLGLGLYISQSLVEAHGGRMWAESEIARGSVFHFALPAEILP
jgi:signal transduction histidine kinase